MSINFSDIPAANNDYYDSNDDPIVYAFRNALISNIKNYYKKSLSFWNSEILKSAEHVKRKTLTTREREIISSFYELTLRDILEPEIDKIIDDILEQCKTVNLMNIKTAKNEAIAIIEKEKIQEKIQKLLQDRLEILSQNKINLPTNPYEKFRIVKK